MEPDFELKCLLGSSFLLGFGLRNLLILSEQELNQLVEQRHLTLRDSLKNNKLVFNKLSRLAMHSKNFRESFSVI